MAYKVWIRRGRDPVDVHDFYALTKVQAEEFLARFVEAIPERMRQLEAFVTARRPAWRPDHTEAAFVTLGEVFEESVEIIPRTRAEIDADLERQRREQPEILELLGDSVRDWELSDRTFSLAYDAGIYLGNDLISKEARVHWRLEIRQLANHHHPVLGALQMGRKAPFIFGCPINIFLTTAYGIGSGHPRGVGMRVVYETWMKLIHDYRGKDIVGASSKQRKKRRRGT